MFRIASLMLAGGLAFASPRPAAAQTPTGAPIDTVVLKTGVRFVTLRPGTGERPFAGQRATVHYTAKLANGKAFETSRDGKPLKFTVGRGDVIPGLDQAVALMKVGQLITVFIPARQAYGPVGQPDPSGEADRYTVPPNEDLIFDVELLAIK